jgi:hypothetical protein
MRTPRLLSSFAWGLVVPAGVTMHILSQTPPVTLPASGPKGPEVVTIGTGPARLTELEQVKFEAFLRMMSVPLAVEAPSLASPTAGVKGPELSTRTPATGARDRRKPVTESPRPATRSETKAGQP